MFIIILLTIKCVTNSIDNMNVSIITWIEILTMHFHCTSQKNVYILQPDSHGVAWWRGGSHHKQSLRGSKMNTLNEKFEFLHSTIFKLLRPITGNSIHNSDFTLKLIISVTSNHCDYSPQASKYLAMLLLTGLSTTENAIKTCHSHLSKMVSVNKFH